MTKLLISRHGQTYSNIDRLITGQADSSLTALGLKHARDIGHSINLQAFNPVAIHSSDLMRCQKTAQEVAGLINLPVDSVHYDARLREIDTGDYSNLPYETALPLSQFINRPFTNGESFKQMSSRVVSAVIDICQQYQDEHVLIVTHSGPISAIQSWHFELALEKCLGSDYPHGEILEIDTVLSDWHQP